MTFQSNKVSGKVYEGRNQATLQSVKTDNKFQSNEWVTFLQARDLGLKIKKGSKAVSVFKGFGSKTEVKKDKQGEIKTKSISVPIGFAKVFNLDNTEVFKK